MNEANKTALSIAARLQELERRAQRMMPLMSSFADCGFDNKSLANHLLMLEREVGALPTDSASDAVCVVLNPPEWKCTTCETLLEVRVEQLRNGGLPGLGVVDCTMKILTEQRCIPGCAYEKSCTSCKKVFKYDQVVDMPTKAQLQLGADKRGTPRCA